MTRNLLCVAQIILVVLFLMNASVSAQQAQKDCHKWYATCDECAKRLGGSGVAGPYPDEYTCQEYVARMKAEGFPFAKCQCGEGAPPQPSKTLNRWLLPVLAAGAGCGVGVAIANGTDNPSLARGCGKGAAIGAAAGALVALSVKRIKFFSLNFASERPLPFVGRQPSQRGGFAVSVRLMLP